MVAYGAGLVVSTIALLAFAHALSGETSGDSSDGGGVGDLIALVVTAFSMAFGAPVSFSASGSSASLFFVPLSVTLVVLVVAAGWAAITTRREERLAGPIAVADRWWASLATGGALGVLAAVLAAIFRFAPSDASFDQGALGANPLVAFVGGVVVGTIGAAFGSSFAGWWPDLGKLGLTVARPIRDAIDALLWAAVPTVALLSFIVVVLMGLGSGVSAAVATAAGALPNGVMYLLTFASFGGITISGTAIPAETSTLFASDTPAWGWLLVLIPIFGVVVASARRALQGSTGDWSTGWATPTVLGVVAIGATLLTWVHGSGALYGGFFSGALDGSLALAPWTIFVAALWGGLIEVAARYWAPAVIALAPPGLVRLLTPSTVQAAPPAARPDAPRPAPGPGSDPARAEPGSTARTVEPVDRRRALLIVGGVAGGLVLILGFVVVRSVVSSVFFPPEAPVESYLAALEDGDAEAAVAMADPDLPSAQRVLLSNDVYGDVEGRPTGVEIVRTRERGDDTVRVQARWDQDGAKQSAWFTVRSTGRRFVLFDSWELEPPEVPVADLSASVGSDIDTLVVNGVDVAQSGSGYGFAAFPGTWEVTLPDASPLLASPTLTVNLAPDGVPDDGVELTEAVGAAPVGETYDWYGPTLVYALTDQALQAAEDQVESELDTCLKATTPEPEDCGIEDWGWEADEATGFRWKLVTKPTITAEAQTPDSIYVTVADGKATTSGTLPAQPDSFFGRDEAEPYEGEVDIDYTVTFSVEGGELVEDDGWW
ncbi:UNVERIFIED_CONTAM: hypothetical protein LK11_06930 [Mumia flava]